MLPFAPRSRCKIELKKALKAAFDQRCAYCGGHSPRLTLDHLHPQSKGGLFRWQNLVPACPRCNLSKGSRTLHEWYTPAHRCFDPVRWERIKQHQISSWGARGESRC